MTIDQKHCIVLLVNICPLCHNPDFIKRINRNVCCSKLLGCASIDLCPKSFPRLILRIHKRRSKLLEQIILRQKIAPHLGSGKIIRNNPSALIWRQVNPHIIVGSRQRSQKILDQLAILIFLYIRVKGLLALVHNKIKIERIFEIHPHSHHAGRSKRHSHRRHFARGWHWSHYLCKAALRGNHRQQRPDNSHGQALEKTPSNKLLKHILPPLIINNRNLPLTLTLLNKEIEVTPAAMLPFVDLCKYIA